METSWRSMKHPFDATYPTYILNWVQKKNKKLNNVNQSNKYVFKYNNNDR